MAQDFERVLKTSIGTSATEIRAAANSDDAIIGMRFANKGTVAVTVNATVKNSGTSYFLIKDAPIPVGGSLELIDGGSKVVLQSGDSVEAFISMSNINIVVILNDLSIIVFVLS